MAEKCLPAAEDFRHVEPSDLIVSELALLTTGNWSAVFHGERNTKRPNYCFTMVSCRTISEYITSISSDTSDAIGTTYVGFTHSPPTSSEILDFSGFARGIETMCQVEEIEAQDTVITYFAVQGNLPVPETFSSRVHENRMGL